MGFGESLKGAVAGAGELKNYVAMVGVGLQALDEAGLGTALAELHDAVVAESKAVGDIGDGGVHAIGCTGDLQQELVLLGLKAGLRSGLFAEGEEFTERVAEFRKRLEPYAGDLFVGGGHRIYRITTYC